MIKKNKLAALAAVIGVAAGAFSVPASAGAPSGGGQCELDDVWSGTFGGGDFAQACTGLFENPSNITTENYHDMLKDWDPYKNGSWTTVTDLAAGGTWTLGYTGDIIIALKQGNYWGAWYLAAPNTGSGGYTTVNFKGEGDDLSHGFALTGSTTTRVPEPATLGLLGLGLAGIGLARRRRRA